MRFFPSTSGFPGLRRQPVEEARERDGFADVLETADPGDRALEANAETGMRDRAVTAEVEIPAERLLGELVLFDALLKERQVVDALRAADDLAVALRREHVGVERAVRLVRVG